MVEHPAEYRWSSYRANAQGESNPLVVPHDLYLSLAGDPVSRQAAYRELFRHSLEPGLVDAIRKATNGNYVLGDTRFSDHIATMLGRRAKPGQSGRPKKQGQPKTLDLL